MALISLALPVEATEEALAAGFGADLVAEFVGLPHVLPLEGGGGGANRLSEDDGGGARPLKEVVVRCHGADFPAEMLDLALACGPYTSFSALQAI
jgi:hypothetical protein